MLIAGTMGLAIAGFTVWLNGKRSSGAPQRIPSPYELPETDQGYLPDLATYHVIDSDSFAINRGLYESKTWGTKVSKEEAYNNYLNDTRVRLRAPLDRVFMHKVNHQKSSWGNFRYDWRSTGLLTIIPPISHYIDMLARADTPDKYLRILRLWPCAGLRLNDYLPFGGLNETRGNYYKIGGISFAPTDGKYRIPYPEKNAMDINASHRVTYAALVARYFTTLMGYVYKEALNAAQLAGQLSKDITFTYWDYLRNVVEHTLADIDLESLIDVRADGHLAYTIYSRLPKFATNTRDAVYNKISDLNNAAYCGIVFDIEDNETGELKSYVLSPRDAIAYMTTLAIAELRDQELKLLARYNQLIDPNAVLTIQDMIQNPYQSITLNFPATMDQINLQRKNENHTVYIETGIEEVEAQTSLLPRTLEISYGPSVEHYEQAKTLSEQLAIPIVRQLPSDVTSIISAQPMEEKSWAKIAMLIAGGAAAVYAAKEGGLF